MYSLFTDLLNNLVYSLDFLDFSRSFIERKKLYYYNSKNLKRNNFVKKIWSNVDGLQLLKKRNVFNESIHFCMNKIRNWDSNVKFFLLLHVLLSFDSINKNRLKNIFRKHNIHESLWFEIEKMINSNIINFSEKLVYCGGSNVFRSLLSIFLLDIYFIELDIFVQDLLNTFNFRKNIRNTNYLINSGKFYRYGRKERFLPIKLESSLVKLKNLRSFLILKTNFLKCCFRRDAYCFSTFDKQIFYVRYINNVALGFISSKVFVGKLKEKLKSHIRSSLHFDVKYDNIFSSVEKNILFCGFNIKLLAFNAKNSLLLSKIKANKKFIARISSRLLVHKKRIVKSFAFQFQNELFSHIKSILQKKSLQSLSAKDHKIWTYIFQLESIRSARFDKLILSQYNTNLLSEELFTSLKYSVMTKFHEYSFNLYISKLQNLLKETISSFSLNIPDSINSTDLMLIRSINEFRKNLFIFYNDLFLKKNFEIFHDLKLNNSIFLSPTNNTYFSNKSRQYLRTLFYLKYSNLNTRMFEVFVPIWACIKKLEYVGILRPTKLRPISNQKLLLREDLQIIKYFGYVSFIFLDWFRCCCNFSKLKFIVSIIRQCCFLTLCRKHNKNKSWAYRVYTTDLIIMKSFFISRSFFPTRKLLLHNKRNFIFSRMDLDFHDEFFLS